MEALFIYLLKSAGILTIFFLVYKFLLQKETFFKLNRHYLLSGIVASLLLPFVVFNTYIYVEPVIIQESVFYDMASPIIENATTQQSHVTFNWNALLFNIYILGVVLVGVQFLIQLFSLYRIVSSGKVKHFNSFKFVEVSQDISPFSFFSYIIYNPENFSEKDLNVILNHEKAHSKQLHSVDIIISQLFVIFQWFNPIVWFYKKNIQQNLEFMADKAAISNLDSILNYQHTLLKVSVPIYCTSITNNFYNSLIKKRIVMLNQTSSKTRNLWKYSLILPALALFLMSFNTKTIEIAKESNPISVELPNTTNSEVFILPVEEKIILPVASKEDKNDKSKLKVINDVIAKITKDTTKEELDKIKRDLEGKGMEFSYSKLDYNSAREITSIKIKYRNEATGSNSSYSVNSDNDEPIKPIYIYTRENGGYGIGNSPDGREHKERMKAHAERLEDHKVRMEDHKARMHEHKERMKEHHETVKEAHEERMEEHRARMEEHKVEMEERIEERKVHMEVRKAQMEERKARLQKRKVEIEMKEELEKRKGKKGNSFVYVTDKDDDSNTFVYATGSSSNNSEKIKINADGKTPLYVVNGEIIKGDDISHIKPDNIASINVLKGKSAIAMYGEDGKDGVIQIVTKKKQSPWKISYGLKSVKYDNNSNEDVKENVFLITKKSTDSELSLIKKKLSKSKIDFSYTRLKRNNQGEISRIKITVNNNEGSKSSSSYNTGQEGIPDVWISSAFPEVTIWSQKKDME